MIYGRILPTGGHHVATAVMTESKRALGCPPALGAARCRLSPQVCRLETEWLGARSTSRPTLSSNEARALLAAAECVRRTVFTTRRLRRSVADACRARLEGLAPGQLNSRQDAYR